MITKTQPSYVKHPRLYGIYYGMRDRCYNEKNVNYRRYGGRGISICQEWREDKNAFVEWSLANGYGEGLQIDRINNDGNYEPSNCRWATSKENSRNTSKTIMVTYGTETKPLQVWCELLNIDYQKARIKLLTGKTPAEALDQETSDLEHLKSRMETISELAEIINRSLFFFDAESIETRYSRLKNKKRS